jgi:AraC-like DNA-binding protein
VASARAPLGAAEGDRSGRTRRTTDPAAAELLVAQMYLPNRLLLSPGPARLDMELTGLRLGNLTAGILSYGRHLRLVTEEADNFHINLPLRGHAVSSTGCSDAVVTSRGQAAIFPPDAPAAIEWSENCAQLCLMVTRADLETELERLIGRSLNKPLELAFHVDLSGRLGLLWRTSLQLVLCELDNPCGVPSAGRHIQGLLLDGLLLAQPHNYRSELERDVPPGAASAVRRAVELMESQPGEAWTIVRLAGAVHLSVRALQEGFRRDLAMPPMSYLREVRLRRVREELQSAHPHATTVRAVASRFGFLHMSRFAAAYREAFGEPPSHTLNRHSE